jgi:hypothetical protein
MQEWRALPWYEQRMYRAGILWEFADDHPTEEEQEDSMFNEPLDDLAALGATVRTTEIDL